MSADNKQSQFAHIVGAEYFEKSDDYCRLSVDISMGFGIDLDSPESSARYQFRVELAKFVKEWRPMGTKTGDIRGIIAREVYRESEQIAEFEKLKSENNQDMPSMEWVMNRIVKTIAPDRKSMTDKQLAMMEHIESVINCGEFPPIKIAMAIFEELSRGNTAIGATGAANRLLRGDRGGQRVECGNK